MGVGGVAVGGKGLLWWEKARRKMEPDETRAVWDEAIPCSALCPGWVGREVGRTFLCPSKRETGLGGGGLLSPFQHTHTHTQ